MTTNNRQTPLTDNVEIFFHDMDILGYVHADFARAIERMCAELAEGLERQTTIHRQMADKTGCKCFDCMTLARYGEMLKGTGK